MHGVYCIGGKLCGEYNLADDLVHRQIILCDHSLECGHVQLCYISSP